MFFCKAVYFCSAETMKELLSRGAISDDEIYKIIKNYIWRMNVNGSIFKISDKTTKAKLLIQVILKFLKFEYDEKIMNYILKNGADVHYLNEYNENALYKVKNNLKI